VSKAVKLVIEAEAAVPVLIDKAVATDTTDVSRPRVSNAAVELAAVVKPICTVKPPPVESTVVLLIDAFDTAAEIWLARAVKVVFKLARSVVDKPPLAACVASCCICEINELMVVKLVCPTATTFCAAVMLVPIDEYWLMLADRRVTTPWIAGLVCLMPVANCCCVAAICD